MALLRLRPYGRINDIDSLLSGLVITLSGQLHDRATGYGKPLTEVSNEQRVALKKMFDKNTKK